MADYPAKLAGQVDLHASSPGGVGVGWEGPQIAWKGAEMRLLTWSEDIPRGANRKDLMVNVEDSAWQDTFQTAFDPKVANGSELGETENRMQDAASLLFFSNLNPSKENSDTLYLTLETQSKKIVSRHNVSWRGFAIDKSGKRIPLANLSANISQSGHRPNDPGAQEIGLFQFTVRKKDAKAIVSIVLQSRVGTAVHFENIALGPNGTAK